MEFNFSVQQAINQYSHIVQPSETGDSQKGSYRGLSLNFGGHQAIAIVSGPALQRARLSPSTR